MLKKRRGEKFVSKKRIEWIDVAKAIGIVAVVFGHAMTRHGTMFHFLYWWHMPIFFIMGGFFLKPIINNNWWGFFKKRILPLLISYLICGGGLILLSHFVRGESWSYTTFYFVRLLWGGRTLNHYLSVFWYINVYLLALVLTSIVITYVKTREYQIIIAFISLIILTSYKHVWFFKWKYIPWDFDVAFIALFFMLFGYLYFHKIQQFVKDLWIMIPCALITLWIFWMQHMDRFNFALFLKSKIIHATFHHIPISRVSYILFIPILVCMVVFSFSYYFCRFFPQFIIKPVQLLGQQTLGIMYLHKAVIDIIDEMGYKSAIMETILAVIISFILSLLYGYIKRKVKGTSNKAVS
ncbi:acyltransferase family protein [Lentilactobacillus hilgardii]|uniref:Acyltransferase n=1 Tax=Lentilactobacillus hilgardii (strain ATCC 8290 / DSM 20176 / CCUG 30140 / JCM 1155 / KCTC 3500 / NBRC 15886 / NCIMB 8040 / NRRL B-1843 / 9) TaxID=1423757 RepID=C0XMJ3_LENH9|nr:acyltransferase family protein [Lentilactobacillus hilgardii]EEI23411.1 acyltransferase [Lentilactobacillus hilgardii DSM 20176 = ATCC 8290]KRK58338.1 acyltransferase 3 [Lentilactobacillus hilgardii DSM 20176 = ATCC 8290]QEU38788.1 acyltransferase family protein [Lentilactobacillus hilgardii]